MRLEPGFGAGDHFVELFGARGTRQLRATLFAAHPRNGGGRIRINGHFRALLVEEGEGMDDGEKFADVVRAVDGAEVKNLAPLGEKDAAVFHRTGISGAGGVDTERLEAHFGQDLGRGHANGADTGSRRGGRLRGSGFGTCGGTMGRDVLLGFVGRGILRFVARGEGFVTRTGKTLDLFATLVPRGVDSGDAAAPNDIELGFLATHGQEKGQRNEGRAAEGERRGERKKGDFAGTGVRQNRPWAWFAVAMQATRRFTCARAFRCREVPCRDAPLWRRCARGRGGNCAWRRLPREGFGTRGRTGCNP